MLKSCSVLKFSLALTEKLQIGFPRDGEGGGKLFLSPPAFATPSADTCSLEDSLEPGLSLEVSLVTKNGCNNYPRPGTLAADCKPLNRQRRFCSSVFILPPGTNFSSVDSFGLWADTQGSIFRLNKRQSPGGIGRLHFLVSLQALPLFPRTWWELANTWRPGRRSSPIIPPDEKVDTDFNLNVSVRLCGR